MAKKIVEKEINLIPREEFESSTLGRTLKWLLTSFRYIVIAAEMIVMAAFLSRFYLDARSADLIDAINQKKSIISSYSTFETKFRQTQNKLQIFKNYASDNEKLAPVLDAITQNLPSDITFTQLTVDGGKIQITGETENESSVVNFITNLNNTSLLTNTKVSSVQSKENSPILSFILISTISERSTNGNL